MNSLKLRLMLADELVLARGVVELDVMRTMYSWK